jgi:predicted PurR-regulated permease PerM
MGLTFVELTVGFLLLKIKYAILVALLVALIDLLPVFGTGTVLLPWGFFELFMGSATKGVGILLLYFVVTIVRNFAEPKIIGKQIGINPLFTLISMLFFSSFGRISVFAGNATLY